MQQTLHPPRKVCRAMKSKMLHKYIVFFPSVKRPSQCEPGTLICLPRVVAGLLMIGKRELIVFTELLLALLLAGRRRALAVSGHSGG